MAETLFTSALAEELAPDTLERFTRYVRIGTQSRRDRQDSPSTPGQLELGRLLADELRAAGLADAELDENGYVMATLPALPPPGVPDGGPPSPVIGLIAHVDTSPDAPGHGVEPIVHHDYDGGVIELPRGGTRLDPESMPELADKTHHDLITASGDTLLGADDKAGVAEIMAAVAYLAAHPELPRPTLRVAFTPDEEVGLGASLFDLGRFGAGCAYTLDGSELGELQDESFSALEAILTVYGVEVHPGQAAGKLVNALRVAARIVAALPAELTPERTSGREGFIHPYELSGVAERAEVRMILRDFDEAKLQAQADLIDRTVREVVDSEPRARYELDVHRQYRNMRAYLESVPQVVTAAEEAMRGEGITPLRSPIRGGTDGSLLSEMGLPTPNIFTGGHEYHSVREWASLQEMAAAAATIVRLAGVWRQPDFAHRAPGPVSASRS
ncbi:MAG TPA: peptidase T [Solirubrobacteraceae bacterium]|nr:peptidase T [Solirubrobacteraceae bacterium]